MLGAPRKLLAAAACAALLVLPAVASSSTHQSAVTGAETSLLKQINRVRAAHGLRTLRYDATLARAARAHTRAMAAQNVFQHGAFASRMVAFHVRGPFVGENLAWGTGAYASPAGIVQAWLESPEHRRNLLRPGFRRIGLGELTASFEGASGANVVTADFAGF